MFLAWLGAWYYTPGVKLAVLPASWGRSALCLARPAFLGGRRLTVQGFKIKQCEWTRTHTRRVLGTSSGGKLAPGVVVGGASDLVVSDTCGVPE